MMTETSNNCIFLQPQIQQQGLDVSAYKMNHICSVEYVREWCISLLLSLFILLQVCFKARFNNWIVSHMTDVDHAFAWIIWTAHDQTDLTCCLLLASMMMIIDINKVCWRQKQCHTIKSNSGITFCPKTCNC